MSATHNLLFVHGIGEGGETNSYQDLKKGIEKEYSFLRSKELASTYSSHYILWAEDLDSYQYTMFTKAYNHSMYVQNPIGPSLLTNFGRNMKSFVHFYLGDVIAYTTSHDNLIRSTMIEKISRYVREPFTILAHSLGSVIINDILFHTKQGLNKLSTEDQKYYNKLIIPGFSSFTEFANEVQKNLQSFVSFGSPISLFLQQEIRKFGAPNPPKAQPPVANNQKWINIYDEDDFLGYPVIPFFDNPNNNCFDKEINVGFGFNAHGNYWDNREVARTIANYLP
jgi:hypothetical protein